MASNHASGDPSTTPLHRVPSVLQPPPMLTQPGVEKLKCPTTLPSDPTVPRADFIRYRHDSRKRRMPQCIAHRGYKAKYPENTMPSFRGAVEVGVQALETDVHVTKDDVVVLSHDPSLKRCYGVEKKIRECTWEEVSGMRSLVGGEKMPRLIDLLEYLAQPGLEEIWLLLDIKLSNNAELIMRLLGETIISAPPSTTANGSSRTRPWNERVLLGIWAAKYLPLALTHLPDFPLTHIGFSISYARHFLPLPNVSFNMLLPMLIAPGGRSFIKSCSAADPRREVFAWTVNDKDKMEWCIRRQLDGVITDDPVKFLDVCERFDEGVKEAWMPISLKGCWEVVRVWVWVTVMAFIFRKMFLPIASRELIRREAKAVEVQRREEEEEEDLLG